MSDVTCPNCDAVFQGPSGRKVKCPACKMTFVSEQADEDSGETPVMRRGLSGCLLSAVGSFLLFGGLGLILFYFLLFDTSIATEAGRVHNVGLMNQRLVGTVAGIGISLVGGIVIFASSRSR